MDIQKVYSTNPVGVPSGNLSRVSFGNASRIPSGQLPGGPREIFKSP